MATYYSEQLNRIEKTYSKAVRADVQSLTAVIVRLSPYPLLAVGSGGSFSAAHFVSRLQAYTGNPARPLTPLDLLAAPTEPFGCALLLITASGRNNDILAALRWGLACEPNELAIISFDKNSPVAKLAKKYDHVHLVNYYRRRSPDGYLAVESILEFAVLLTRAYGKALSTSFPLPEPKSLRPGVLRGNELKSLERPTWVILHSAWGTPAAIDLESKLTESALRCGVVSDYRNFGHGRHYWLAKRAQESVVIAFSSREDRALASKTLSILPSNVPVVEVQSSLSGPGAGIELIVKTFQLVGALPDSTLRDLSRPEVPLFGRKLYSLSPMTADQKFHSFSAQATPIRRKLRVMNLASPTLDTQGLLDQAFNGFLSRLTQTRFGGLVCDYDGTLCSEKDRYLGLSQEIIEKIRTLLDFGLVLGVATGRGKSVRIQMRRALSKKHWDRVIIGYYNGAEVAKLSDEIAPDINKELDPGLIASRRLLQENILLRSLISFDVRPKQITVWPKSASMWMTVRSLLLQYLIGNRQVKFVESTRSMDIIPTPVSKLNVLMHCEKAASELSLPKEFICIGDKGEWPGNDSELLSTPFSLSVDECSPDPNTCWNFIPSGLKGPQGTLWYLNQMQSATRSLRMKASRLKLS